MSRKPLTLTAEVQVSAEEVELMRRISRFIAENGSSPKRNGIVASSMQFKTVEEKKDIKRFARLVLLGLIEHSTNGHCWITSAGSDLLERAK